MADTWTITANGTTDMGYVGDVPRNESYLGTLFAAGNFQNGTLKFQCSPDGGITKIDVPKSDGSAMSFTANGMGNLELGTGGLRLYAVMTGATSSPSVNLWLKDSN